MPILILIGGKSKILSGLRFRSNSGSYAFNINILH